MKQKRNYWLFRRSSSARDQIWCTLHFSTLQNVYSSQTILKYIITSRSVFSISLLRVVHLREIFNKLKHLCTLRIFQLAWDQLRTHYTPSVPGVVNIWWPCDTNFFDRKKYGSSRPDSGKLVKPGLQRDYLQQSYVSKKNPGCWRWDRKPKHPPATKEGRGSLVCCGSQKFVLISLYLQCSYYWSLATNYWIFFSSQSHS